MYRTAVKNRVFGSSERGGELWPVMLTHPLLRLLTLANDYIVYGMKVDFNNQFGWKKSEEVMFLKEAGSADKREYYETMTLRD
jgi:hypothetical protein